MSSSDSRADSVARLSPAAVGRLRRMDVGDDLYSVFTTGDQLLWGAAEPLRRVLSIILAR